MIIIDLSKQYTLDVNPKTIQPISFIGNLENNATIFIIDTKTILDFSQVTVRVLSTYFALT